MRTATMWTAVALAVVVILGLPALSLAAPDPANSSAAWSGYLCDGNGDKVLACPGGDGHSVLVTVLDALGQPHVNGVVDVTYDSPCLICLCPPMAVTTDVNGHAVVDVYAGLLRAFSTDCCVVTTTVTCDGVVIPWDHGGDFDEREWISPDLNGDCIVDGADEGLFNSHFAGTACICDYNCDGSVNTIDFVTFAAHYSHGCPASPITPSSWSLIKALYR